MALFKNLWIKFLGVVSIIAMIVGLSVDWPEFKQRLLDIVTSSPEPVKYVSFPDSSAYNVLIVEFDDLSGEKKELERILLRRLENTKQQDGISFEVRIDTINEAPLNHKEAKALGNTSKADFVIYGASFEIGESVDIDFSYVVANDRGIYLPSSEGRTGRQRYTSIAEIYDGNLKGDIGLLINWIIGNIHLSAGNCSKAISYLIRSKEYLFHGTFQIARCFSLNKNLDSAVYYYRRALMINPEQPDAYSNYATLLYNQGKVDSAFYHFRRTLTINPEHPRSHNNYAILLERQGQLDSAGYHYRRSLTINPKFADACYNYALHLENQGQFDSAGYYYRQTFAINPKYAVAHNNYAILLNDQGQYDSAGHHYRRAFTIDPKYAEAYYNYAIFFQEQDLSDSAGYYYQKTLAINPGYVDAEYNYANLFDNQGQFDSAGYHYRRAIAINPRYVNAHHNYAILLYNNHNYDSAGYHFLKAYQLDPDNLTIERNYKLFQKDSTARKTVK